MTTPAQPEFKSEQYEFNADQNRTLRDLAFAMRAVGNLIKLVTLALLVFFVLQLLPVLQTRTGYGPVIGLGAATLFCATIAFCTSSAAAAFLRIVESKNQDIWHLMRALERLRTLYGALRTIIMLSLALLVIGLAWYGYEMYAAKG